MDDLHFQKVLLPCFAHNGRWMTGFIFSGSDQEPPEVLYRIHEAAGSESGWLTIMQALVNTVPLEDTLGPAVIELIIDNCPLPSKQDIHNFLNYLRLNRHIALAGRPHPARHRNICKSTCGIGLQVVATAL